MMGKWGTAHLLYLLVTAIFIIVGMVICRKANRTVQNIIFITVAIVGSFGIFYRYALGFSFSNGVNLSTLWRQTLQVCNFNFILLPIVLIRKNELGRQYLYYFSMFCASTIFASYSKSIERLEWNNIVVINFWLNHLCAVALPLFMFASRRFKPQKKYIPYVVLCIFIYYAYSGLGSLYLMKYKGVSKADTASYIFTTDGIPAFEILHKIIPIDFVYLLPLLLLIVPFYYWLARLFKNYKSIDY